jgi:hypothetical protein
MIAPESAGAADKDPEMRCSVQRTYAGFPSMARRQRP